MTPRRLSSKVRELLRRLLTLIATNQSSREWIDLAADEDASFSVFMRHGVTFAVEGESHSLYLEVSRALQGVSGKRKSEKPEPLSWNEATGMVLDAMADVLEFDQQPLAVRIPEAIAKLEQKATRPPRVMRVCLPVMGVQLKKPVNVGNVRFLKGTPRPRIGSLNVIPDLLGDQPDAWAVLTVRAADPEAGIELGWYHLQLALDVINLYSRHLHAETEAAAYRPGHRARGRMTSFIAQPLGPFDARHRRIGTSLIQLRSLARFVGFRRVKALIDIDRQLTQCEDRLLSALRWIGRAALAPFPEQAFLNSVVALESLLLGARETELSYRFRIRGAQVLAKRGSELHLFKALNEMYAVRSAVVHRGSFHVTAQQSKIARHYATLALLRLLSDPSFKGLKSNEDVEDWFNAKALGHPRRRQSS